MLTAKISKLAIGLIALGAFAGCDSARENVREAQRDLSATETEAARDVREAQAEAARDINAVKEKAAADIRDARRNVAEEVRDLNTTSATTRSIDESMVTREQCARFAGNLEVRPADRALYEACSKKNYR